MNRWIRLFGPIVALAVVIAAGVAALGRSTVEAQQPAPVAQHVAVAQPAVSVPDVQHAVVAAPVAPQAIAPAPTDVPSVGDEGDQETQDRATQAALAAKANITEEQAKATALAAHTGTTVTKVDLEEKQGVLLYTVALSDGTDVMVDAHTGVITATEASGTEVQDPNEQQQNETTDTTALAAKANITEEQAKATALAAHTGTTVTKVDLEEK